MQLQKPATPRMIALELLYGCNLKCNYCYVGMEKNFHNVLIPNISVTFSIIDKLSEAGVQEIYLVGGEPTAHPYFDQICEYLTKKEIPVLGLCTNGTLITDKKANTLKELGFYANVSFRGGSAETFDSVTGVQGSFERTLKGTLMLSKSEVPLGIEYDCTTQTAPELYSIVQKLFTMGIRIEHVLLHRISPNGDAKYLSDKGQMNLEQYANIFLQVKQIASDFNILITFEDGFPLCLTDQSNWSYIVPCECGIYLGTIDPVGNIRRCACHPNMLGNVLEEDISYIWSHSLQDFRSKNWMDNSCKSCSLLEACRGGCAVSSASSSQGYAPDIFSERFVPFAKYDYSYPIRGISKNKTLEIDPSK